MCESIVLCFEGGYTANAGNLPPLRFLNILYLLEWVFLDLYALPFFRIPNCTSSIFYIQLGSPDKGAGHTGSGYTTEAAVYSCLFDGPLTVDIRVPLVVDEYFS